MRTLFVIMPFGTRSDESVSGGRPINFDAVYQRLIRPAATHANFKVLRIDEVVSPGSIGDQYLRELFTADVVLADISVPNANVFYELGIRQAMGTGPTVLIAQEKAKLPFDIQEQRVVFYRFGSESDILREQHRLMEALRVAAEKPSRNPIQRFLTSWGVSTSSADD
jgi:hypothetical protein